MVFLMNAIFIFVFRRFSYSFTAQLNNYIFFNLCETFLDMQKQYLDRLLLFLWLNRYILSFSFLRESTLSSLSKDIGRPIFKTRISLNHLPAVHLAGMWVLTKSIFVHRPSHTVAKRTASMRDVDVFLNFVLQKKLVLFIV